MTESHWGVAGLTVTYGSVTALDEVTLDIPDGAVAAVVGGDGAGKTTLLRTIAGALVPARGRVLAPPLPEVGFMPTASGVWRELTVDENISFVAAAYGIRGGALGRRRDDLLEQTGLARAHQRLAGQLSGGMRQKLAFGLAMLHQPRLLVLDEPSTGVDPVSRVDLWRMISQAAAQGAAVVMATTYLDEAERSSSVLVLDGGRTLLAGAPEEVVADAPGVVVQTSRPTVREHAWRRGRQYHEWVPEGAVAEGDPVPRDLEDAVISAALAKEAAHA
ncbi:ABC transporter ATP-binding protein [Aldersonia sp. NBC_00410]|uniref:ABC transporter ATP-binding protein n=1 Tax=Aldersonia sp. NBC_00410 TaxID=2975954 RepID=UPI00225B5B73|nr:ABC transporter ATP-binding protein [Aldersonia sp. NBC_00410]MCX5043798.1 ABC transporter ATP-binding protein [Aldersonia sp. NBC_00410]